MRFLGYLEPYTGNDELGFIEGYFEEAKTCKDLEDAKALLYIARHYIRESTTLLEEEKARMLQRTVEEYPA